MREDQLAVCLARQAVPLAIGLHTNRRDCTAVRIEQGHLAEE